MKLVITEKPSVAQTIAKVIGATERQDGYLVGNGYIVSWCVGHLVELAEPGAYDEKYEKWRYGDLPILPEEWKYQVSENTKKQFAILRELMKREDVESLVCATDAGREGELIFRLVYQQCRCRKSFERLWISSMEDSAIVDGFENLKPGTEYDALYEAALCRERADWLVGINATRLFSTLYGQTLNVGRVMTPTLAMAVAREANIAAFTPETFYTVQLDFDGFSAVGERIKDKITAQDKYATCAAEGRAVVVKVEEKEKSEKPPLLYDLTSLQREANRILGFTAQQTLDYTQSLYEKKLVTYPRTDSRYLTEDMEMALPELVDVVTMSFGMAPMFSTNTAHVVNNKRVTDHHAIIPTKSIASVDQAELPAGERDVLMLIATRLLEALSKPCVFKESVVEFECAAERFRAKGKVILEEGFKSVRGKNAEERRDVVLPKLEEGATLSFKKLVKKEGRTTPPKHFTEDTLLQAMERAGADEMPEEAERKGIGTPATRAGVIEKLMRIGFLERQGDKKTKYLIPTHKGTALITVMPELIQSPSMTAEWEELLLQIEKKEMESKAFMDEIANLISELVATYEVIEDAEVLVQPSREVLGKCPHCGSNVVDKQKAFSCENRVCKFALWKDNRFFESLGKTLTKQITEKLLQDGKVKLKGCRSAKTGKNYDTTITLATDTGGRAKFAMEFD